MFCIGIPIACLLLILIDRLGRFSGGRFSGGRGSGPRSSGDGSTPRSESPGARTARRDPRAPDVRIALPSASRHAPSGAELNGAQVVAPEAVHVVQELPAVHALVATLRPPRP